MGVIAGSDAIVSVEDMTPILGAVSNTTALQGLIDGCSDVVEHIVGPVRARQYTEWHEGGKDRLLLMRHPVLTVETVTEFQGPLSYTLNDQTPTDGVGLDAFGYFVYPDEGIVERTAYGMPTWFAAMPWWTAASPAWLLAAAPKSQTASRGRVKVVYTAGRTEFPAHIVEGTKELVRINYQQTQQGGRSSLRDTDAVDDGLGVYVMGFFVPNRVRELLQPSWQARGTA